MYVCMQFLFLVKVYKYRKTLDNIFHTQNLTPNPNSKSFERNTNKKKTDFLNIICTKNFE